MELQELQHGGPWWHTHNTSYSVLMIVILILSVIGAWLWFKAAVESINKR